MQFQCAWCNKLISAHMAPNGPSSIEETISHSICLECITEMHLFEQFEISDVTQIQSYSMTELPVGMATIDKHNRILQFSTNDETIDAEQIQGVIGKNYFKEVVPFIRSKEIGRKLGGLRRRKRDGQIQFHIIIRHKKNLLFVQIELNHFVRRGETLVTLNKIREE